MIPSEIKAILKEALKAPVSDGKIAFPPMFLEGPPGVGKSAMPRQAVEELNMELPKDTPFDDQYGYVDIRLAQRDTTDLRGIPAVIENKAVWLPPPELPLVSHGKKFPRRGIMILDEITSCPPLMQATAYQVVLDHSVGEEHLKPEWYIMGAGNQLKDRAVVYRMSTALANRFFHVKFDPNLQDWQNWAMSQKINPNIIGFINWRADLLAPEFDPESDEKAFPTPRTWEYAHQLLAQISNSKILHQALNGCLGTGATSEFMAFLKCQTELPDITTILEGKSEFVPPANRMDLRYALISALATRAKSGHYENMVKYSYKLPPEFSILLVQTLAYRDETAMAKSPSWPKWAREHSDVIVARKRAN